MKFSWNLANRALSTLHERGTVLSIGAFDGVHQGHQAILHFVRERAQAQTRNSLLLSFSPLPRAYFGQPGAFEICNFRQKFDQFAALGIDHWLQHRFDAKLAAMSPEQFVKRVLVDGLAAREVHVGEDFRFGAKRAGDIHTLRALGQDYGFAVQAFSEVQMDGQRVSASGIRRCIAATDFAAAARLLARPYRYQARVQHGQKLGRTLGFPTANLPWPEANPLRGIFAVRVCGEGLNRAAAVASLGTRPVVHGKGLLLEVHLFDFAGDLYGRRLEIEFVEKLREEKNFNSLEALVAQIEADARAARQILAA